MKELKNILPDWYFQHFSEEQKKELIEFKRKVDKAIKEKNRKEIKDLIRQADKIKEEMNQNYDNLYFRKSFIKIIINNPLYLNMTIKELNKLIK